MRTTALSYGASGGKAFRNPAGGGGGRPARNSPPGWRYIRVHLTSLGAPPPAPPGGLGPQRWRARTLFLLRVHEYRRCSDGRSAMRACMHVLA